MIYIYGMYMHIVCIIMYVFQSYKCCCNISHGLSVEKKALSTQLSAIAEAEEKNI